MSATAVELAAVGLTGLFPADPAWLVGLADAVLGPACFGVGLGGVTSAPDLVPPVAGPDSRRPISAHSGRGRGALIMKPTPSTARLSSRTAAEVRPAPIISRRRRPLRSTKTGGRTATAAERWPASARLPSRCWSAGIPMGTSIVGMSLANVTEPGPALPSTLRAVCECRLAPRSTSQSGSAPTGRWAPGSGRAAISAPAGSAVSPVGSVERDGRRSALPLTGSAPGSGGGHALVGAKHRLPQRP